MSTFNVYGISAFFGSKGSYIVMLNLGVENIITAACQVVGKNVSLATTMSYYIVSDNIQQSRVSAETRTLSISLSSSQSSSS